MTEARRPVPVTIPPDCDCTGCTLTAAALVFHEAANRTAPALIPATRTIVRLVVAGAERNHGIHPDLGAVRRDIEDGLLVPVHDYVAASLEFAGGEPDWTRPEAGG